ncbi:hypothetical protein HDV01_004777 [Terramyces sp. JEL0728]|nr:hypothetical protein HDV01_004777 [Terramyces sp. JEL0728]
MSDSEALNTPLIIANGVLWSLFGHFSQSFDWLAVYLWMVNDFQLTNPIVRALVLMPALRLLGDATWEGIDIYDQIYNTQSVVMKAALPSPLWYAGELMGDTYLPLKATVISGNDRNVKILVWGAYSFLAAGKIGQDAVWEGLDAYDSLHNTTSGFAQIALPSPLWYAGELMGDMYLPLKASTIASNERVSNILIWGVYSLIAGGKISQIIGRCYYWYQSRYDSSQAKVAYFVNTADIYIMFVGILSDLVCSIILYSKAKDMFSIKRKQILKTIQTNSSFRIVVYTIFKVIIGIYWAMNICDATYVDCPFYFLRDIIITLDYQLYYLDYFLIQYFGKEKKKAVVLEPVKAASPASDNGSNTVNVKKPATANKSVNAE